MKEQGLRNLKSCLVVDVGGGTVDISAITMCSDGITKLEVALPPTGNDYGGTKVNKAIRDFLGNLVNDKNFEKYSKNEESIVDWFDIDRKIEEEKCFFGKCEDRRSFRIRFPASFIETYGETLESMQTKGVTYLKGRLEINIEEIEKLFKPAVDAIENYVHSCFKRCNEGFEAVFLVGGFGACNYIYRKLAPVVESYSSSSTCKSKCTLYRSSEHMTAVVSGAVMFRRDPEVFRSRVADATYGTVCCAEFDKEKHSEQHKIYDDDLNLMCSGLFSPMVEKDEKLDRENLLVNHYFPAKHNMTEMHFPILATDKKDPGYYAQDPHGTLKPGITQIGNVTVPMPDPTRRDKSRKVMLKFDFSDTEIQVEAYDMTSGKKAFTMVDFLGDWENK